MALAGVIVAVPASAPAAAVVIDAAQGEIARGLEAQFQVSLIRERKLADDRESAELQAAEVRLLAAHKAAAAAQGDAKTAQSALSAARADYAKLAESLTSHDAEAQVEIAAYQLQVADLTRTADPELTKALAAYGDGDRVGAYPIIKRLLLAENAAAEAGVAERNAERLRNLATDAVEMAERSEGPVDEAINEWEAAQAIAPIFSGWTALCTLYTDAGRMNDAIAAAQKGLAVATEPTDRATALIQIGVLSGRLGDLASATRSMLRAVALVKDPAQAGGPDSWAAYLWTVAYGNLGEFAEAQDDPRTAERYQDEESRLFPQAKGAPAAAAATDARAKLFAELDREADQQQWDASEATARRLIDWVKQSDAYVKGDEVEKASLLISPVTALRNVLSSEAGVTGTPDKIASLHDALVDRMDLETTLAERQHIVGEDFNYQGDATLDVMSFDLEAGKYEEARQLGDKLVAIQDARHTDASHDLYEEMILARALQMSAVATLDIGLRDHAASAFADAAPLARRAAALLQQPFDAAPGGVAVIDDEVALSLLTEASALLYHGDLVQAQAPMQQANALYERLTAAHPNDRELMFDMWVSRYGMAKLTNDSARWRQLEAFLAVQDKAGALDAKSKSWLAEARSHLAAPAAP